MGETVIAVIGLGYVGLPLAVEFAKHFETIGFDIDHGRVLELRSGHDRTLEVPEAELSGGTRLTFTADLIRPARADVFVVTVPTPVDRHKRPGPEPARVRQPDRGKGHAARRNGRLRVHRLPGRHGGDLRTDPGGGVRADPQPRLHGRLLARSGSTPATRSGA